MHVKVVLLASVVVSVIGSVGLLWLAAHRGQSTLCVHGESPLSTNLRQRGQASSETASGPNSVPALLGSSEKNPRGLDGSAGCGGSDVELVIGVLASPTPRSTAARKVIRETWLQIPVPENKIVVRFLLALNASGQIPGVMQSEAKEHGDMVFLDTLDAYRNLVRKVHLFFVWVSASCPYGARVFKTDDDSFVRLDKLYELAQTLPIRRLYYGSFLRHMPARWRNKTTKKLTNQPLEGNVQNMAEWPWYASGGGYMLSGDLVHALAHPPLPRWHQTAEDRAVGVALFGYNVTYMSAGHLIRPWGACHPDAVMLHYQRDPGLLRRRYSRAIAGANICGEGWSSRQACVMVDQGKQEKISCKKGQRIRKVRWINAYVLAIR